jgi:hypothetical protein
MDQVPKNASPSNHADQPAGNGVGKAGQEYGNDNIPGSKPGPVGASVKGSWNWTKNLPGSMDDGMFHAP